MNLGILSPIESGKYLSPEEAKRQQAMAQYLQTGAQQPVKSWSQGLANALNGVAGVLIDKRVGANQDEAKSSAADAYAKALSGGAVGDLESVAGNPYLNPGQSSVISTLLGQKLKPPDYGFIQGKDGSIYRTDPQKGSVDLARGAPASTGSSGFEGTGAEVQGINELVKNGTITRAQAAAWLSSKIVNDPETGKLNLVTPNDVYGKPVQGGPSGGGAPQLQPDQSNFESRFFAPDAGTAQTAQTAQPQPQSVMGGSGGGAASTGMGIALTGAKPNLNTMNEGQSNAATYADRMAAADSILGGLESQGTDLKQTIVGKVPVLGNYGVSADYQKYDQAKRDFINATLRKESGAVISPEDFDNADKQYFPQPGNGPEVLAQKRENRRIAVEGMKRAAGPTYKPTQTTNKAEGAGGGSGAYIWTPEGGLVPAR